MCSRPNIPQSSRKPNQKPKRLTTFRNSSPWAANSISKAKSTSITTTIKFSTFEKPQKKDTKSLIVYHVRQPSNRPSKCASAIFVAMLTARSVSRRPDFFTMKIRLWRVRCLAPSPNPKGSWTHRRRMIRDPAVKFANFATENSLYTNKCPHPSKLLTLKTSPSKMSSNRSRLASSRWTPSKKIVTSSYAALGNS